MPVANHRYDCTTHLWETSCPNCDDAVYFFSYSRRCKRWEEAL